MNPFIATAGIGALGYAAVTIPRNARKARAQRAEQAAKNKRVVIDPAEFGLVPGDQLDERYAGPDPEADAVAAAAVAGDWRGAAYQKPFMTTAIDATLDAVDQVPAGHHRLPTVRHLLANALFRTERFAEGVEQFRAVGAYVGGVPWSYSGNSVKSFVHARTNTFIGWDKAGRPAPPARATR
ncbi:hypothetical protein ACIPWL_25340 [Streptomyces sp. NPDC090023]|uniref:hypothetical protein n=1 Tax=unclassified Streptomyces TaxID=2593676 RepID=UPI0037F39DBE